MKYCQGTKCHTYKTKDRIRGIKGDKHYETRRRSEFYYGDNFCSLNCQDDWFREYGTRAIDHFGRVIEAKRQDASNAWYKDCKYNYNNGSDSNYTYYFVNDLLGQRINLSLAQYQDKNFTSPN